MPWEWEESVLLKKGDLKQMNENMFKIVLGCLLHDLGKIPGSQLNDEDHCKRGYDLLQKVGITDKDLLDQVLYHHNTDPFYHSNNESSLVYITETANDIVNRKTKLQQENQNQGDSSIRPLESIFNILNGNRQKYFYSVKTYTKERDINYPVPDSPTVDQKAYDDIAKNMEKCLLNVSFTRDFVHLLLDTLHNNLSYVSSLQGEGEIADISLYDHLKMTACIGVCILRYLESLGCRDYKTRLKTNKETFYSEKAFLLFEMDVSGIQDFIYTVSSERALKTLRARSFYLEIMVEHLIDELLESIGLTRVNLMYSGGGHAYLLLPNTRDVIEKIERFEKETNRWFLKTYKTSLYVACGYSEFCVRDLRNIPKGSYGNIFRTASSKVSAKKLHRYGANEILELNQGNTERYDRECVVCKRTDFLISSNRCGICDALEKISTNILRDSFFSVVSEKPEGVSLPLPGDRYLVADTVDTLNRLMARDLTYVRSYGKNNLYHGHYVTTRLWVGDYTDEKIFDELARAAEGIERIAVLRADVDDLGQAFVSGFESERNQDDYVTLSRTASFSRKLSEFFKLHINYLLEHGEYRIGKNQDIRPRNATIVYSGGDDIFIVGSWDDIIGFTVDLYRSFNRYSQGTLTLSAGIGIYPYKYPIAAIAKQTGELESRAKSNPGKNSIALFTDEFVFSQHDFIHHVLEEKYSILKRFFGGSSGRGRSFLHNLLILIQNRDDRINLARYAHLLARMAPGEKESESKKALYREFSKKMVEWMQSDKDSKELVCAIHLYDYITRERR